VHAGDAEQAEVGGDVLRRLDRGGAAGDRRVLEDPAPEQEELRLRPASAARSSISLPPIPAMSPMARIL